ncbi:S41 family peptidase [uncultured Algibacter sp.]|uniref:S41 family peptidase n=1 Tax=uncultured Algibacter sp. TaxID=298659 RepID=UPI00260C77B0|nr:S41 family peptidase [uncultured Algibacter sp.]
MKRLIAPLLLLTVSFSCFSCFDDNDDNTVSASQINDFVWKGMNSYYLYLENSPDLANDRFANNGEYASYLNGFSRPEDLFESLIYEPETIDRFSWIVDDYFELERQFQGTRGTNGLEFNFYGTPNNDTNAYGVIRLVLPESPAGGTELKRGDIIYGIDGTRFTRENIGSLRNKDTYTLNLGFYNDNGTPEESDDSIDPLGKDITLTKVTYTEDPIFRTKILNVGGQSVGYLMYNGFIRDSENQLNSVFENFKGSNITELVLDLRYNPGGSVLTTAYLASMITGQFAGQTFEKLIYNDNQADNNFDFLFYNTLPNEASVNSVGLNKVYILATGSSASASEGLINGLKPYIEVVHIGTNTVGKTQASRTLYDSPDFTRDGVNPAHTYAMQPLIADGLNKNNEQVPGTGLVPTLGYEYKEDPQNFGVLGDKEEPMLALALADIENATAKTNKIKSKAKNIELITDSNEFNPREGGMHID